MTDITDITDAKVVYVSTSKNADYVSATDHEGCVKYIRADAPELVALVEALRPMADLSRDIGPEHDFATVSREQCDNAASALTQWEALTK